MKLLIILLVSLACYCSCANIQVIQLGDVNSTKITTTSTATRASRTDTRTLLLKSKPGNSFFRSGLPWLTKSTLLKHSVYPVPF